jgi:hypothetical protein
VEAARRREKNKSRKRKGGIGIHPQGREGWRRSDEEEEGGRKSTYVRQHASHSAARSCVRSFVRFFVMTVDETMTYFSGFSLPGCPAALAFTPSPVTPLLPLSTRNTRGVYAPPRVHPGCNLLSLHPTKSLVYFLPLCRVLILAHIFLSLNPFLVCKLICKTRKHLLDYYEIMHGSQSLVSNIKCDIIAR